MSAGREQRAEFIRVITTGTPVQAAAAHCLFLFTEEQYIHCELTILIYLSDRDTDGLMNGLML